MIRFALPFMLVLSTSAFIPGKQLAVSASVTGDVSVIFKQCK